MPTRFARPSSSRTGATRRRVMLMLGAAGVGWPGVGGAQGAPRWVIGQSAALSGPLGPLGAEMHHGARIGFDAVNALGGVHGRLIELRVADDAYSTPRTVENVKALMADRQLLALFNCMGTPMIEAILPAVTQAGIPFFAPFSGALSIRPRGARNVFPIRLSYPEEAEALVHHLHTISLRRLGVVFQNNSFGAEILEGVRQALAKRGLPEAVAAPVESSGDGADAAAQAVVSAGRLEAVLIASAGKPAINTVHALRARSRGLSLYGLSVLSSSATVKALGEQGVGMAVSQVMPSPDSTTMPVVRAYREAWAASGTPLQPSYLGLEGFINAKVFVEALRRAGPRADWATFNEAVWSVRRFDVGGFEVSFTEPGASASRFIELTMLSRNGRFLR